jgi:chemotaxis protein MotB
MKPQYYRPGSSAGAMRDRWMISYLDVLTILLVFFVAAAARALQPTQAIPVPPPAAQATTVVPPAPDQPIPSPSSLDEVQRILDANGLESRREPRGLVISLPQTVLFGSGDDQISPAALPMIAQVADILSALPNQLTLLGNADDVPIHNVRFRNNWELASARSLQLLELLAKKYGIEESRLSITSYGSFHPKEDNDSQDGRAANRRVEITVLDDAGERHY